MKCLVLIGIALLQCHCVNNEPSPHATDSPTSVVKQRHLLTPESEEDLTKLSDSDIQGRIVSKRRELGRLMNQSIAFTLDHADRDFTKDAEYQDLLRQTKQTDTDLHVLEREIERRASSQP